MKQTFIKFLFFALLSIFSYLNSFAQDEQSVSNLLDGDFIYVDSSGAFGTMDSTLLDLISNLDSNYVFVDSLGNVVTTNEPLQNLLDSINLANFGLDSTFFNIVNVDSLGTFMTNDSILQQLLKYLQCVEYQSLWGNPM